ncbi:hypothetical protein HSBAA_17600 [Vreelandella sulfidaeris]|uniref:Adaptor protein ClpS core domain-containing protein n=1 Tax=Vreelandella sulfidaeris TaxID=115553 RepID=A0A455UB44_9GAMM|nr:hypothetical protein HSBAA_17600 [Halomonas sulfidaeris]
MLLMSNLESSYWVNLPAYAGMTRPDMPDEDDDIAVQPAEPALAQPPLYKVVLHNDDYTPMEFVIEVLQGFFNMDSETAVQVMLAVHTPRKGHLRRVYSRYSGNQKLPGKRVRPGV